MPRELIYHSADWPDLLVNSEGGACPFQARGTLDGDPFYFRYRWGIASLQFDLGRPEARRREASIRYGDDLDGCLTTEEFERLLVILLVEILS